MTRRLVLLLGIVGLTFSAFAFSGSNMATDACPLRGTPACPEYPACCR